MKLRQVSITGYRSIRECLDFAVDGRVTVILGANDHGKTNVLQAIRHLNQENAFEAERDLNWDFHDRGEEFPRVEYTLTLVEVEREALLTIENAAIRRKTIREFREALEERSRQAEDALSEAQSEA